jgi:hypothetical protein
MKKIPSYTATPFYRIDIAYDIIFDDDDEQTDFLKTITEIGRMAYSTILKYAVQVRIEPFETVIQLQGANKREVEHVAKHIARNIISHPGARLISTLP